MDEASNHQRSADMPNATDATDATDAIAGDDADAFPPGLSQPAPRALDGAGYSRLSQLTGATVKELLALHGMGPKGTRILRGALAAVGLSFARAEPREARVRS